MDHDWRRFQRTLCRREPNRAPIALLAAILAYAPFLAFSQLPSTEVTAVDPPVIPAGTTTEVRLLGANLEDLDSLHFSDPRIKAEKVLLPASEFRKHPAQDGTKFRVTVPPDVAPGTIEIRAAGYFGISPSRPLIIAAKDRALLADAGAVHHERETAPELPREALARGKTDANRIDWWKITAKKGERVLVHARAERIDSRADLALKLVDATGRELELSRDEVGRDPLIDFTAPADGTWWVGAHDTFYLGGDTHFYLLEVTSRPWIDAVFPPAGQPGQVLEATVLGRNLPGGSPGEGLSVDGKPLETVTAKITMPAAPPAPAFSWSNPARALVPTHPFRLGNSNAAGIGFAAHRVIPVQNDAEISPVTPPCEIAAKFETEADSDTFRLVAKKGTAYWVEVIGDRLHGRLDPYLLVEKVTKKDDGTETFARVRDGDDASDPGGATFPGGDRDTTISFTADQDGEYRVTVANQFADGSPRDVYRLVIREARPDFRLVAVTERAYIDQRQAFPAAPLLRKGGTFPVRVLVDRIDGFDGPVTISAEGLPAGVTCPPVVARAKESTVRLVFAATPEAAKWDGTVQLVASAKIGDKEVKHPVRSGAIVAGTGDTNTGRVRTRLELGVPLSVSGTEQAPAVLGVGDKRHFTVTMGETLEIPIKVPSRVEAKGNLVVAPVGLRGLTRPPTVNIEEKKTDGAFKLKFAAQNNVFAPEPGTWNFVLRGTGTTKYKRRPEAATRAEEEKAHVEALAKKYTDAAAAAKADAEAKRKALEQARANLASATPDAKPQVEAAAKAAETAFTQAEKKATEAEAKRVAAEKEKAEAAKRADAARKASAPKDTAFAAWSLPITVEVKPAPEKK